MSIEQLLFLLLLVALPLLERLIRAMRARTSDSAAERARTVAEPTAERSRPPRPAHDAGGTGVEGDRTELSIPASPLPPALPQAVRDAAPGQLRPSERGLRLRQEGTRGRAGLRTGQPARPVRPRTALRPAVAGGDVRRAIVLMAILGPCRALEPTNASPPG